MVLMNQIVLKKFIKVDLDEVVKAIKDVAAKKRKEIMNGLEIQIKDLNLVLSGNEILEILI